MNWMILVGVVVIIDTIRIFIDNYVSDVYFKGKSAASQKILYGFLLCIFSIIVLSIVGFDKVITEPNNTGILVLAGFINGFSGIYYYKALEIDDSTNLGIFIQLAPVLYLIIGWVFLGETFEPMQLLAFAIILAAPILIVAATGKRSRKIRMKAVLYSFLYVFIAVVSNIIFVEANGDSSDFVVNISLLLLGKGIADILIVLMRPKWYRRFKAVVKSSKRKVLRPMCVNFVVGTSKEFLYRIVLLIAPSMAVASAASDSSEPIVIFFMGLLLTLIWPKFGREKLNKRAIIVHLIATILVVVGIVMLQNQ